MAVALRQPQGDRPMSNDAATAEVSIDISEILERIPHRYPFLLVDRAEE